MKSMSVWIKTILCVFIVYTIALFFYKPHVTVINNKPEGDVEVLEDNDVVSRNVPFSTAELKASLDKYNTDNIYFTEDEDALIDYAYRQFSKGKGIIVAYSGAFNDKDFPYLNNEDMDYLLTRVIEDNCKNTMIEGIVLWGNIDNYNKGLVKFNAYTLICMSLNYKNTPDEMEQLKFYYSRSYDKLEETYHLTEKSDYEKVKIIHDYICENFDYDENLNNYDDYSALSPNDKGDYVMVCQGYSLMCAKFLNMAGVPCRIVLSEDTSHSWNIVKLDGKWYQLDITHDDTGYFNNTYDYKYFLRSSFDSDNDYNMIDRCFLYSSLSDYEFADKDYVSDLHNRFNINPAIYEFFYRTIYTSSRLFLFIVTLIGILILQVILFFVKRYFYKKKVKRNRDYRYYNDF